MVPLVRWVLRLAAGSRTKRRVWLAGLVAPSDLGSLLELERWPGFTVFWNEIPREAGLGSGPGCLPLWCRRGYGFESLPISGLVLPDCEIQGG